MSKSLKIGFFGLTHLGTCYSISVAENNPEIEVIACEINDEIYNERCLGTFDKGEPGIDSFLKNPSPNFKLTNQITELSSCDFVYVSLDTPISSKGISQTDFIYDYFKNLHKEIPIDIPIIILSQINPGFTRRLIETRKNIYYQVETLIFGQGLSRASHPEMIIIGSENNFIPKTLYDFLITYKVDIKILDFESAELTKMAINFYLASTLTTTNVLSEIARSIGADWTAVSETLKLDKRIGKYSYLRPGLGIGGTNIRRDLIGLKNLSISKSTESSIIDAIITNSQYNLFWILRIFNYVLQDLNNEQVLIGLLGLTYKENTNSTKNSSGFEFLKIVSQNFFISVYDPVVSKIPEKNSNIIFLNNAFEVINNSSVLVIATPWGDFKNSSIPNTLKESKVKVIIDPFKCIRSEELINSSIKYYTL